MAIAIEELILPTVVAAIVGAVASLVAPWANWGVDKKKKKLLWRKGFINECKKVINKTHFRPERFRASSLYSSLRPNVSIKLQKEMEEERRIPGRIISLEDNLEIVKKEFKIKRALLNEITIIEKKWGLL